MVTFKENKRENGMVLLNVTNSTTYKVIGLKSPSRDISIEGRINSLHENSKFDDKT